MGFWEDITGKTAANTSRGAAADQYKKQQSAIEDITSYGNRYATDFRNLASAYDPYVSAGSSALSQLMAGLGLGGDTAAFTSAYRSLPGYQSGLETGQNAALAAANAGGRLNSGATQKALLRYGSDYEDQRSGSFLDRLFSLAGMGQTATGQQVATVGQGLQGQLGTRQSAFQGGMQSAGTIAQGEVAAAQAQQSALTNLMNMGAYLGGQALGAAGGGTNLYKPKAPTTPSSFASPWSGGIPTGVGLNGYGGAY